jgi:hypothetical protein
MSQIDDMMSRLAQIDQYIAHLKAELEGLEKQLGSSGEGGESGAGEASSGSSSGGSGLNKSMAVLRAGMSSISRFSGSKDLAGAISKMQTAIGVAYELRAAYIAAGLAEGAVNPFALGFAIFGLATTATATVMANVS